jgi:hypothetical protein
MEVADPGTAKKKKGNRFRIIFVEVIPEKGKAGAVEKGCGMGVAVERAEAVAVMVADAINKDRLISCS